MLVRLCYASRATQPLDDPLLRSILEPSRARNRELGITGILCTYPEGGIFLQVLEGARREVSDLYTRIVQDPRHGEVTLLSFEEIRERRFAGWRMGSVDLKKVNLSTILRFSEKPVLDPFSMSGPGALALIEELASAAAIVSRD